MQGRDSDTELIQRHLGGDEKASQTLIETYQDMVYGLAYRMLGSEEDARDAAQDAFLSALDALTRFRGECAFSTWLYRITVNGCMARNRLKRRLSEAAVDSVADKTPSSLDQIAEQERDGRLREAISELGEIYRTVIVLHYFQGLPYEEMAQVLEGPVGTVKIRPFRAKRLLGRKLRARRIEI